MTDDRSSTIAVYYPQQWRGWFVLSLAAFLLILWIGIVIAVNYAPPPKNPDATPLGAGFCVVMALILWPGIAVCGWIGWGVLRSRVRITEDTLDMTTHRFAIWLPSSVRRVRLPWSDVFGVEIFEQTNPYAPDGVQKNYVIHTPQGRFSVSNILWPRAAEIAEAVAAKIGRNIGDVPDSVEHAVANRPGDRIGLKAMHGCGLVAMVLCGGMLLLLCVALLGGMPVSDFARAAIVCGIGFSAGASMWKWRMKS